MTVHDSNQYRWEDFNIIDGEGVEKALITLEKHPLVVKQCEKLGILVG